MIEFGPKKPCDEEEEDDKKMPWDSISEELPYYDKEDHLRRSVGNDERPEGHIKHLEEP